MSEGGKKKQGIFEMEGGSRGREGITSMGIMSFLDMYGGDSGKHIVPRRLLQIFGSSLLSSSFEK